MKLARNVCTKYSLSIFLALLISATIVHGIAFAEETFSKTAVIAVPGGLNSFDIGFVDPQTGLYFLADRTNKTVDQVKTSDNSISQLAVGSFVGVQPGTNTSGPNGVITANDHREVWAGDGVLCGACGPSDPVSQTSRIQVIDLKTGNVTHTIDNGGNRRADELCEDPQHHVVLVANDDESDLFLTFISTQSYKVLRKIHLDGSDRNAQNIKATNGIEQCQWSPRTGKFYLAVPQVGGTPGANDTPGVVLEINPASMKVQKVFPIEFGFVAASGATPATANCLGPQGLAIGPQREILLGCSNSGPGTVIIDERDGSLVRSLPGLNGNDEVWFNPGDNHYFLAGSNHTGGPILGVVDVKADNGSEDASATSAAGSHSVAADPVKNQVYVPGNKAATALCGGSNGCIAVFTTTNDDPGLCSGPDAAAHGQGKQGDPGFLRHVCPNNNGSPDVALSSK
jgi:hypothetical protein